MIKSRYVHGDYNVICDRCGRKLKRGQARRTWDNLIVCPNDWEPRQPQDLIRAVPDSQRVPEARPEGVDTFITSRVLPEDL